MVQTLYIFTLLQFYIKYVFNIKISTFNNFRYTMAVDFIEWCKYKIRKNSDPFHVFGNYSAKCQLPIRNSVKDECQLFIFGCRPICAPVSRG